MGLPVDFEGEHPKAVTEKDSGGISYGSGPRPPGTPPSGSDTCFSPATPASAYGGITKAEVETNTSERAAKTDLVDTSKADNV